MAAMFQEVVPRAVAYNPGIDRPQDCISNVGVVQAVVLMLGATELHIDFDF